MSIQRIKPGLFQIWLRGANAFLLDSEDDGLVLIDTGVPGSTGTVEKAVRSIDRELTDIRHILVTHCHSDHTGSLAELKAETGARVYMHTNAARLVQTGRVMQRLTPSPGIINKILFRATAKSFPKTVDPMTADEVVDGGEELPIAGGISVIHTPGHSADHVVFLSREWDTAFLGDAACNMLGLRPMFTYENVRQGLMSLRQLCNYDFDTACFGHGYPIRRKADSRFRRVWARNGAPGG